MAVDTDPVHDEQDDLVVVPREPLSRRARSYRFGILALIILTGAWRLVAMTQWSWQADDWLFLERTVDMSFWEYLFQIHNGHLQPGQFLIMWGITAADPLNYAYAVVAGWLLSMLSLCVWALLFQRLFGDRWAAFVGLVPVAMAPGFVPIVVWTAAGLTVYALQLFLGLTMLAALRWIRDGKRRSLVLTAVVYVVGLAFWEKTILAVIPVMGLALLLARTRAGAVLWRRLIALAAVLGVISVGYIAVYLTALRASSTAATSWEFRGIGDVANFYWVAISQNLLPALSGGPVPSAAQVGSGLLVPTSAAQWVVTAVALVLTMWGLARRRRGWIPVSTAALYVAVSMGLVVLSSRYDFVGLLSALDPRYAADSLAILALMGTLLLVPARGEHGVIYPRQGGPLRLPRWVMPSVGVALLAMALATSAAVWDGIRPTSPKPWVDNFLQSARTAGDASVLDSAAAANVINGYLAGEDARLSRLLVPLSLPLRWNGAAPRVLVVGPDGVLGPAALVPSAASQPGPDPACGYEVLPGSTVSVPMTQSLFAWQWGIEVRYSATGAGTLLVETDTITTPIPVTSGSGSAQAVVVDSMHVLRLSSTPDSGRICVGSVALGLMNPAAATP